MDIYYTIAIFNTETKQFHVCQGNIPNNIIEQARNLLFLTPVLKSVGVWSLFIISISLEIDNTTKTNTLTDHQHANKDVW